MVTETLAELEEKAAEIERHIDALQYELNSVEKKIFYIKYPECLPDAN